MPTLWSVGEEGTPRCVPGTKMHKLQQYLQKKHQFLSGMNHPSHTSTEAVVMDEDEELERAMLSISPSQQSTQNSAAAATPPSSTPRRQQRERVFFLLSQ
ncbi:hypothetical protein Q5P01_005453 [Channa striata]|uniref:Uncharacterized protein n=1 Tax=Channa striata TaxID=64152 RepID=A0AA88SYI9_CHASR|nr:hypothetical protein Q5P01_005453 [Channa striata]